MLLDLVAGKKWPNAKRNYLTSIIPIDGNGTGSESNKKDGNVKFDFMINGVRAGYEDHQVIRDTQSYANNN